MLRYQPKPGAIVKCNFKGYILPEIIKTRPVVVINSHKTNSKLVTVVPLSTVQPVQIEHYHHELDFTVENNLVPFLQNVRMWFKCDLVYVVTIDRLDRCKDRTTGSRNTPHVSIATLQTIKDKVKLANKL